MDAETLVGATPAESWSMAAGLLGRGAVLASVSLFVVSIVLWIVSAKNPKAEKWAKWTFGAGALGFLAAIAVVVTLFVKDQFQYKYVFSHGSRDTELQYKIAGAWAGQEGSILLWGTMSAIFCTIAAARTGAYRRWFSVVSGLFLASVAGILAFESPFALNPLVNGQAMVPLTGKGLNPSLMNYWVVIHPPTIFSGFGSLTVLFAFACAALLQRDLVGWAPLVRPWALVSLTLLGLGLAMGGFWAYETLGWGGFWMWDPVENTSFVPWVAVAALLHGIFVQVSRKRWYFTNVMLAGLPFLLFCYGTFLTRSGYLGDTSVHSFAEMDSKALKILIAIVSIGLVGFLSLWFSRLIKLKGLPQAPPMQSMPINRESVLGVGVWILSAFGLATAIGMSVPFFQLIFGKNQKVVEEPLYNTVLSFFFIPMVFVMAVAPFVTWRGIGFRPLLVRFLNVFSCAVGVVGLLLLANRWGWLGLPDDPTGQTKLLFVLPVSRTAWVLFLAGVCAFGICASSWKLLESFKRGKSSIGGMVTHIGVGLFMLGLIYSRGMEQKVSPLVITPTTDAEAFGYRLRALGPTGSFVDRKNKVQVSVAKGGDSFVVSPGLYFNGIDEKGEPIPFIWPGIHNAGSFDLYMVLHNITFDASGETDIPVGGQRLLKEEQMLVTYKGLKSEGPLGQAGATFKAQVTVDTPEGKFNVEPTLKVGQSGIEDIPAKVGDKYSIRLARMNAADKSATLQVRYQKPAYIAELYYKPLTLLVWWGVGIMTIGGGLTAWTRRRPVPVAEAEVADAEPEGQPVSPDRRHAPEPVAQV
ncbi:MAG: cytochrome c biogenesis protein CcsA [Armatimonadetes bacterium]|nr:cytochrome c biogenesis protein CcsA [Armatimonadota bacterium]